MTINYGPQSNLNPKRLFGPFERLKHLTDDEKEILYRGELERNESFGSNIGPLKVEYLKNEKGMWAYRIYTHEKTGYETSPGLIESKYRYYYDGKARVAAEYMVDLYWMACNRND
jgi:hypothetical protein